MSVKIRRRRFYASYGCGDNDTLCVARATRGDLAALAFAERRVKAFAKQKAKEEGPLTAILRWISPIGTTTAVFHLKGQGAQTAEELEQLQNRGAASFFTAGLSETLFSATGERSQASLGGSVFGSGGRTAAPILSTVSGAAGGLSGQAFGGNAALSRVGGGAATVISVAGPGVGGEEGRGAELSDLPAAPRVSGTQEIANLLLDGSAPQDRNGSLIVYPNTPNFYTVSPSGAITRIDPLTLMPDYSGRIDPGYSGGSGGGGVEGFEPRSSGAICWMCLAGLVLLIAGVSIIARRFR